MTTLKQIEAAVDALIDKAEDNAHDLAGKEQAAALAEARTALLSLVAGVCKERDAYEGHMADYNALQGQYAYLLKAGAPQVRREAVEALLKRLDAMPHEYERNARTTKEAAALLQSLWERCEVAEKELERERMRLAGCGVAALGYFDGCHDDYKSASLDDVLRLVESEKAARAELARCREALAHVESLALEGERNSIRSERVDFQARMRQISNRARYGLEAALKGDV